MNYSKIIDNSLFWSFLPISQLPVSIYRNGDISEYHAKGAWHCGLKPFRPLKKCCFSSKLSLGLPLNFILFIKSFTFAIICNIA